MYDWIYEELDPELNWKIYLSKKNVLSSLEHNTIMLENGLTAENLLNKKQLEIVREIRKKKMSKVFEQFEKIQARI